MKSKKKSYHVGGEQLPLILPTSDWKLQPLPDLRKCEFVALDRECRDDGLAMNKGPGWVGPGSDTSYVCGVSLAWRDGDQVKSGYFPVQHPDGECVSRDAMGRWELDHQKAGVRFVMQNAPYDVGWGDRDLKVPVPKRIDDLTCMAVMVDENRLSYDLNSICRWRGVPGKDDSMIREVAATYGYPDNPVANLWRFPARYVASYAEQDAVATLLAAETLRPVIKEEKLERAYATEMALLPVVHHMRKVGIRIDQDAADQLYKKFRAQCQQALDDLSDRLGHTVTVDHLRQNKFLQEAHDAHRIEYPRTKTGAASFEAKWMKKHPHWLPRLLSRAKSRDDAADKFVRGYIQDFMHNGRIHASVQQFRGEDGGTRTYRFAYSDPPLQQMPKRDEEMFEIRRCFIPDEGETWARADYSQQEYRLIVHYAALFDLRRAREAAERYRSDPSTDFHEMVAGWTGLDRKPAKDLNFAKSYGAGKDKVAQMMGKSVREAIKLIEIYNRELPFVEKMAEKCQKKAEQTGFIRLLDGARIRFDFWVGAWRQEGVRWSDKNFMADCRYDEAVRRTEDPEHPWYRQKLRRSRCNKALNSLIQGGAARQTKTAMVHCWEAGLKPILQVHDELNFSLSDKSQSEDVVRIMCDAVPLEVPMMVDMGLGPSWGEAE